MADFSIGRIARRGFRGLLDPRGRDDRMQFWIFLLILFGPILVIQIAAQIFLTFPGLDTIRAARPGSPDMFEYQMRGMVTASYVNVALYGLGGLLLLTAAARRLHDRGRSGWWAAVLPFCLFATGLGQAHRMADAAERMPQLVAEMERKPMPGPRDMAEWMTQANVTTGGPDWPAIIGGLLLLWLVVELARTGASGNNRFGPPPG